MNQFKTIFSLKEISIKWFSIGFIISFFIHLLGVFLLSFTIHINPINNFHFMQIHYMPNFEKHITPHHIPVKSPLSQTKQNKIVRPLQPLPKPIILENKPADILKQPKQDSLKRLKIQDHFIPTSELFLVTPPKEKSNQSLPSIHMTQNIHNQNNESPLKGMKTNSTEPIQTIPSFPSSLLKITPNLTISDSSNSYPTTDLQASSNNEINTPNEAFTIPILKDPLFDKTPTILENQLPKDILKKSAQFIHSVTFKGFNLESMIRWIEKNKVKIGCIQNSSSSQFYLLNNQKLISTDQNQIEKHWIISEESLNQYLLSVFELNHITVLSKPIRFGIIFPEEYQKQMLQLQQTWIEKQDQSLYNQELIYLNYVFVFNGLTYELQLEDLNHDRND